MQMFIVTGVQTLIQNGHIVVRTEVQKLIQTAIFL